MNENLVTIKHSFNLGDLIVILPLLKKLYEKTGKKTVLYQRINMLAFYAEGYYHPTQYNGENVCMNIEMWDKIKPLLEKQLYIEKADIWQGQRVDYDFDLSRMNTLVPIPNGDIHSWATFVYPELTADFTEVSIIVPKQENLYKDTIVINFTERYRNPYIVYFFLKHYQSQIIFAGTEKEHNKFCKDYNLDIPLLKVPNFYELAIIINSCKLFIGCQSFCWHLADSLKSKRILEVCTAFPNTLPTGKNGYFFTEQKALEYYFKTLINE